MATILVVDSYLSTGLLYQEVLKDEGHRALLATRAKEALCFALHERIDVVIVDEKFTDLEAGHLLGELKRFQPHIRGVLCAWEGFGHPAEASLWDGIFFKSHDFTIFQAKIGALTQESSEVITLKRPGEQEHRVVPVSA